MAALSVAFHNVWLSLSLLRERLTYRAVSSRPGQKIGSELTNQIDRSVSIVAHLRPAVLHPIGCFGRGRLEAFHGQRFIEAIRTPAEMFFELPEFKNAGVVGARKPVHCESHAVIIAIPTNRDFFDNHIVVITRIIC